jgi:hypothetical protein
MTKRVEQYLGSAAKCSMYGKSLKSESCEEFLSIKMIRFYDIYFSRLCQQNRHGNHFSIVTQKPISYVWLFIISDYTSSLCLGHKRVFLHPQQRPARCQIRPLCGQTEWIFQRERHRAKFIISCRHRNGSSPSREQPRQLSDCALPNNPLPHG